MDILALCPPHTDIQFLGPDSSESSEPGPLGHVVFSTQSNRAWWSNISSVYFVLRWIPSEWQLLKSVLVFFKRLKFLSLDFESNEHHVESQDDLVNNYANAMATDEELLSPIDSLTFKICFVLTSAGDFGLLQEIASSWPGIRRLSIEMDVLYRNAEILEAVSSKFYGTQLLRNNSVPERQRLEEFHVTFTPDRWDDDDNDDDADDDDDPHHVLPKAELSWSAWIALGSLLNLKALTLNCYVRLNSITFASLVRSTPQLEHFKSFHGDVSQRFPSPWLGLGGLFPSDLLAVGSWKRLRTCYLTLDIPEKDLASPPLWRKFAVLKETDFMPSLVERWKADLNLLELVDVSCRVVVNDKYSQRPYSKTQGITAICPLVYGCKCDCGKFHFHIDADSAAAKCLGFLKPDESDD